jgi:hypothetical protein
VIAIEMRNGTLTILSDNLSAITIIKVIKLFILTIESLGSSYAFWESEEDYI